MSYNSRATAEQRYLSARYNRRLRRMQRIEETEGGEPVALVCRDESRRAPGKSGKEGAFLEACRVVKLPLVPVIIPNEPRAREDAEDPEAEAARIEALHRSRAEAIHHGTVIDDSDFPRFIGFGEAAQLYGHIGVDPCEKTYASKIGKR